MTRSPPRPNPPSSLPDALVSAVLLGAGLLGGSLLVACTAEAGPGDYAPAPIPTPATGQAVAVLAGGCFWCVESDFDKLDGVVHTTSGYIGGRLPNPSYDLVVTETTGHAEAVHVVYDTKKLTYEQVLEYWWRHIDPTDAGGQFCDRGNSYRAAAFPLDDAQKRAVEASRARLIASGMAVRATIETGHTFYAAEVYHQDFHDKNPGRYYPYRMGCGRDAKVAEVWRGR